VIYLDTSVALAHLLGEDVTPPAEIWDRVLVSSRLLEFELLTRVHARGLGQSHTTAARALLDRVAMADLSVAVLGRALEPFPEPVRTLDALHLATAHFLRSQGQPVEVATLDRRMRDVARQMGMPVVNWAAFA
jgi:predicted nucleic acid-binding protein